MECRSDQGIRKRLDSAISKLTKPGPRRLFRVPISPPKGFEKAAWAAAGFANSWMAPLSLWMLVERAELEPVTTAGLSKTKPTGKAPVLVLKAKPECAVKMVENCQPPIR